MVADTIDGKSGFRFQMRESVLKDGFWYEGSPAYHFYSLDALRWTALGAKMAGTNLVDIPQFRAMFKAPTRYLFPDMSFPGVNDSYSFSISKFSGLYDLAYSWYGDKVFALAAEQGKRDNIKALFWGVDTLPETSDIDLWQPVSDSPGVGGALLTQSDSRNNPIAVHIHYGPHGGYHGHPDKLALIAFADGKVILPDPGRVAYASPLQEGWYKTTLAHNTLVVDRKNQKEAKARSIRFCEMDSLSAVQADCPDAYPGVNMVRTTVVTPNYLIDLFTADSKNSHVFDLPYHFEGKLKNPPAMEPCKPLGEEDGYDQLKDLSQSPYKPNWSADFFQDKNKGVRFTLLGDSPSEIYLSSGRIENPPRFVPMLLLSQSGKQARFLSLIEPFEGSPAVTKVDTKEQKIAGKNWIRLTIVRNGQKETIEILQPKLPLKKSQEFIRYRKS